MVACALSFAAGALTVFSPCVLPLALIAVASALRVHRLGPVALAAGLAGSSAALGLLFARLGFAFDRDLVRVLAAALLVVLGLVLLSGRLQAGFGRLADPLARRAAAWLPAARLGTWQAQAVVGALLGAIWTPCAGPTLAAAITLAAQRTDFAAASAVIAAYSVGAALPLLAMAYVSRETLGRRAESLARVARPVTGLALLLVGILTLSGGDRLLEARLLDVMPGWLIDLTTKF